VANRWVHRRASAAKRVRCNPGLGCARGAARTEKDAQNPDPERPCGGRFLNAGCEGGPVKSVFEKSVVEWPKDEKP
jgi:hypothetical protein